MPAYHYEVFKFMKGQKRPATVRISIGENFIKEASLIENGQHDIIIACTYSKKGKGVGTDGIFLAALDDNGKLIKYKNGYYQFPWRNCRNLNPQDKEEKWKKMTITRRPICM